MRLFRWNLLAVPLVALSLTGCWHKQGCCRGSGTTAGSPSSCCGDAPMISAPPPSFGVQPAAPPPQVPGQSFSIGGPSCAVTH